jgi:formate/nitrite transporter FocA (FNT family)
MSEVDKNLRLASAEIYEVIAKEGNEELNRPFQSLAWSAVVAGICISFSLFCEGFLMANLENPNFLVENMGYTVGFLIVIIGRFQLFTENTITVVLPLLDKMSAYMFRRTARLWGIVFVANMIGTFLVALLASYFPFFSDVQMDAFLAVSDHAVNKGYKEIFFTAIPAGFLIAALVWMMPSIEGAKFWIVILVTYVIAIGDFAHVVAGSAEAFLLILNGETSIMHGLGYLAMAAAGNIIGGTGLFALMAYAQVQREI